MQSNSMSSNNIRKESGNVLFLILIAVALFAALSYAVSISNQGKGKDTSAANLKIAAAQITQYTALISATVDRMILSGIDITDIDIRGGPATVPCTTGVNCVFAPEGGDLYILDPVKALNEIIQKGNSNTPRWLYSENATRPGVAGGNPVILIELEYLNQQICQTINIALGLGSAIPSENNYKIAGTEFFGYETGCYDDDLTASTHTYFHVLALP